MKVQLWHLILLLSSLLISYNIISICINYLSLECNNEYKKEYYTLLKDISSNLHLKKREKFFRKITHVRKDSRDPKFQDDKVSQVHRDYVKHTSLLDDASSLTTYHYQHMKNYTKLIGLRNKLVSRFSRNLEVKFPYKYIIKNDKICSKNIYLLNFLLTKPNDFKKRKQIRNMWGDEKWKKAFDFQVIHLLGQSQEERINKMIKKENDFHSDIIQVDFVDSYDNLTVKVLSGLHWVTNYCSNSQWVMKSDVDVMVNVLKITRFLRNYEKKNISNQTRILCKPKSYYEFTPLRNDEKYKKWNVNYEEYPFDTYPPHCYGPAYIIPRSIVPKLYEAADKLYPFRIEDVYYTGVLPQLIKDTDVNILDIHPKFGWRPRKLTKAFTDKSILIFEVEKYLGIKATDITWKNILQSLKKSLQQY